MSIEHAHVWGEIQYAPITDTESRSCTIENCRVVNLDTLVTGMVKGMYVTCDDAICIHCWKADPTWIPFEEWEDPAPIFFNNESDTPTHCVKCEALIDHALTSDGYEYVAEAIADFLTNDSGRYKIVMAWALNYSDTDPDELDAAECGRGRHDYSNRWTHSRIAGTLHKPCVRVGCRAVLVGDK